jgi:hypothetical protein
VAGGRSLDHFVIAIRDVEAAGAQYERLGIQVTILEIVPA